VDLGKANDKILAHLQWCTTGKHSLFKPKMPYLHLSALSATLLEVADVLHLSVV